SPDKILCGYCMPDRTERCGYARFRFCSRCEPLTLLAGNDDETRRQLEDLTLESAGESHPPVLTCLAIEDQQVVGVLLGVGNNGSGGGRLGPVDQGGVERGSAPHEGAHLLAPRAVGTGEQHLRGGCVLTGAVRWGRRYDKLRSSDRL